MGCHSLLQGIFLIQGSNPHLLQWQADSLPLSHQGGSQGSESVVNLPKDTWSGAWPGSASKLGLPRRTSDKDPACRRWKHERLRFDPRVGKIPWRRKRQPTPVVLPGKSNGQGSLAGYSLGCCKRVGHDLVTKTAKTTSLNYFKER